MSKAPSNLLTQAANSSRAISAWKFCTFVVTGLMLTFAYLWISQVRNAPVVIVPYEAAIAKENMKVSVNGELRGTSSEYMANLALADLGLILNFTPDNVISQHQRFLNRLTEELYGTQRENLLAQASEYKQRSITQAFYPESVKVSTDSTKVELIGTQIRWIGGKDIRTPVTYILTYKSYKGFAHVSDLRQKSDESTKNAK